MLEKPSRFVRRDFRPCHDGRQADIPSRVAQRLHGQGTWVFTGGAEIGYADYEGEYWLLH